MIIPSSYRRNFLRTGLALGLLSSCQISAFAHRQKQTHSSIAWNGGNNILEITHRLHMHDAERALAVLGKINRPDLSSLKARALLALQIETQFKISDLDGDQIFIEILGAEIEGPHVYVYQEAKLSSKPDGLLILNQVLHDVYPDQMNHVNIEISDTVRTAVFASGDKAKKVLA